MHDRLMTHIYIYIYIYCDSPNPGGHFFFGYWTSLLRQSPCRACRACYCTCWAPVVRPVSCTLGFVASAAPSRARAPRPVVRVVMCAGLVCGSQQKTLCRDRNVLSLGKLCHDTEMLVAIENPRSMPKHVATEGHCRDTRPEFSVATENALPGPTPIATLYTHCRERNLEISVTT